MGNQSSTPSPNKLSKPKTNTNSVAPAYKGHSPEALSTPDLGAQGRQHIRETLLSLLAEEFDQHPHVQQKESALDTTRTRDASLSAASRTNSRSNSRPNSRSNSLSCFGSKNGSTARLAAMSDSKLSLVSGSHVDIAEAIKLLQQLKKNASPEDIAALHQVLEMPEESAEPEAEPSASWRSSPVDKFSPSSLTRRQSLIQTPGVGTRSSPVDGRRRTWNSCKSPRLEPEEEAKWQSTSGIASQLAFAEPQAFHNTSHYDSRLRVPSPSELDYSHLGSLKPGTLVVTNGPASPASSIRGPNRARGENEDYFSEAERGNSPLMMKTTQRRGHRRSQSAVLPGTSLSTVETIGQHEPYETVRCCSTVKLVQPTNDPRLTRSTAPANNAAQAMGSNTPRPADSHRNIQLNLVPSPSPASGQDHTVDKHGSFTSDDTHYPKSEETPTSQELVFTQNAAEHSPPLPSSVPVQQRPKSRAKQRPPPRTTDSGYSSVGSLPVDDREQQAGPRCVVCSQCQHHGSRRPQGIIHDKQAPHQDHVEQCAERIHMSAPVVSTVHAVQGLHNRRAPAQPALASVQPSHLNRSKSSLHMSVNSGSSPSWSSTSETLLSPQTPRSASSKPAFNGTSGKPPKRLHRRQQSQAETLVVQSCQPIPEGKIPGVPAKVRAQFERRVSSTPGMDCLIQTYPSKDHVAADDSRPEAPLPGHTEFRQLAELQAIQQPTAPTTHVRRKSLPFFRGKSASDKKTAKQEAGPFVVEAEHMEPVVVPIGASPWDGVMCHLPRQTVPFTVYPHQLERPFPRPKSMVNLDSRTAAEYRYASSKQPGMPDQEVSHWRRKSFHNLSAEAGEAGAWRHRPQNAVVPPVPSIDMARLSAKTPQANKRHSGGPPRPSTAPRPQFRQRSQTVSQMESRSRVSIPKASQQSMQREGHPSVTRQRRKTIGEGTRPLDAVVATGNKRASIGAGMRAPGQESTVAWGRYSGGLAYEYEGRTVGVGGSAGTRQLNSCASVKSLHYQHQYGVDLSDVPIMVQRV